MNGRREADAISARTNQHRELIWNQVEWIKIKARVEKMQRDIFQDTRNSAVWKVKQEQKLMVRSLPARLWAVHLVTEVNEGRFTPGVDNVVYNTDEAKVKLVENLRFEGYKPFPARRGWIPKPDKTKRKLGLPAIRDRAMEMLVYLAMSPEWEVRFEPHSFGFRPGRSPIDAVHHMFNSLLHSRGRKPHPGWTFDADISKCFDNISHESLLNKIDGSPFQEIIKAWLKSGVISEVGFEATEKGTPQGGVISPLLANIALHGMELLFGIFTRSGKYVKPINRKGMNKQILFFRYADDFIVFAPSKRVLVYHVIPKITAFLAEIGLSLNSEKTRVVNISEGIEFLGFRFQRYFRKDGTIKELEFCPSRKRLDQFLEKTKEYIRSNWNKDVVDIIRGLNYKIIGFCNYFKWSKANRAFGYLSYRLWEQLWSWARKRHPKRGRKWIRHRYWQSTEKSDWTFTWQGKELVQPYARYDMYWWRWPKLRILASPFDPLLQSYWADRRSKPRIA